MNLKKAFEKKEVKKLALIIVALLIVVIILFFLVPRVIKGGSGNGRNKGCIGSEIVINSCVKDGDNYKVLVENGFGDEKLKELRFNFKVLKDGAKKNIRTSKSVNLPGKSGEREFIFSSGKFGIDKILSARVAGVFENGNSCGFSKKVVCYDENVKDGYCGDGLLVQGEGCDDGNLVNGDGCSDVCVEETSNLDCGSISDYNGDFDKLSCTRKRFVPLDVRQLPVLGFHNAGSSDTTTVGAEFVRMIVAWYKAYDSNGDFSFAGLDKTVNSLDDNGLKLVLTLRTNDPDRSECGFDVNEGRGYDQVDSYPLDEQVWKNYVSGVVDRYYVQPLKDGKEPVLVGIQLGNEWASQFKVSDGNGGCISDSPEKGEKIVRLYKITREAIDEASLNLPSGEKRIALITFGITAPQRGALVNGFNPNGKFYDGTFDAKSGVFERSLTDGEDYSLGADKIEQFLLETKDYYDYIDLHIRFDYYEEPGYVLDWIRDFLEKNSIKNKGIVSLEYAGPFHLYTPNYHEYIIPVALSDSFYHGFDAIAWAPWNIGKKLKVNFWLMAMKDWNAKPRQYAMDGYKKGSGLAGGFTSVQKENEIYRFDGTREINVDDNVPLIPDTFEQCSDGLDNDNNGLIDGSDGACGVGSFTVDVEFDESGIYF